MIKINCESIIIHGTGMIGEKFYIQYKKNMKIDYFLDLRERTTFHGKKVISPEKIEKKVWGHQLL